jgi:hypothetical protein
MHCPGFAPVTRPEMVSILPAPPGPASGTVVNSIEGGSRVPE